MAKKGKLTEKQQRFVDEYLIDLNATQAAITDYQITDVYFEFTHEVMSNEQENEQNELTEAQKQQVQINTLLSLAQIFGDDLTIQYICDVLDIDYEDVKDKLPDNEADKVQQVQDDLDSIIPDDEGGGIGEQGTEGSTTDTA